MSPFSLQVLADKREALLLAEVAAWLHMLGKFHEDFLNGRRRSLDIEIPSDLTKAYPQLDKLLRGTWAGEIWKQLGITELQDDDKPLSVFELIKEHRNRNAPTGLQRLMQDAHGRGAGTEKGTLNRFFPGQQGDVFLSTALGHEPRQPIDLSAVQRERQALYAFLEERLTQLKNTNGKVNWSVFRRDFISRLENAFRLSVAETRRPINDITLFDQTFASVAFLKAALAQILLRGWHEPKQKDVANKYHWRILRVGLDGLRFWGQAARLNDLLSRKGILQQALNEVKTLLEATYPLGMEMYRDENGSLFIVSDVENLLEYQADGRSLRDHLQEIAHKQLTSEAAFDLELSPRTRNMLSFGQMATQELAPPAPSPDWVPELDQLWRKEGPQDICPVCGLRPQGPDPKSLERKVCRICEQRRSDRSKAWVHEMETTIWTNEVADTNGRMVLIAGRFGLDDWLTGKTFSSVMAFDLSTRKLRDEERNNKEYLFDYRQFISEIQQALSLRKRRQTFGNWVPLLDNLILKNARGGLNKFPDIYKLYVSDTDLNQKIEQAHLFALALMRQQPSPARLRRVWETTRAFWQETEQWILEQLSDDRRRLKIYLTDKPKKLGPYHVYDLQLGETELDVVWVPPQNGEEGYLLSADNLGYIARRLGAEKEVYTNLAEAVKFVQEQLQRQKQPVLYNPDAGAAEERVNLLEGIGFRELQYQENRYATAIPILAEPRSFMMLVPADKTQEIVAHIKAKYEREMGKVRNRLPLALNLVFFERKTPLIAVLDAARAMLGRKLDSEQWTVAAKTDLSPLPEGNPREVRLTLKRNGRQITVKIPTVMGDGATFDPWYPYWRVEGKPTDRRYWFIGPDGEHWVHVKDLRKGDTVYFTPATMDYLWLDSAARRFDAAYDEQGGHRPWTLENFAALEALWQKHITRLSKTQIKQILQTIESARERWFRRDREGKSATDKTFRQFVKNTLAIAAWPKDHRWKDIPEPTRQALTAAAARGELTDLEELHFGIMKEDLPKQTSQKEGEPRHD